MKFRTVIILLGISCLGGYLTTSWNATGPVVSPAVPKGTEVPVEISALAGAWEGLRPDDLPVRLVVEDLHEHWATVRYTWGDRLDRKFHRGWERVRALVFPGGKLFWRRPGDFTFQLSDDWTALVGTREQGGATATSLMRRVPGEAALSAVNAEKALVTPMEGHAMSNAVLTMIGWGLFYWMMCLYVFWVIAERTFFAGSDPERWDPHPQTDTTGSIRDDHRPTPHFPQVSTLGRPA